MFSSKSKKKPLGINVTVNDPKKQFAKSEGLKTTSQRLEPTTRFFLPFLDTMVICLISSNSLTIKWDAFATEKEIRETREKR